MAERGGLESDSATDSPENGGQEPMGLEVQNTQPRPYIAHKVLRGMEEESDKVEDEELENEEQSIEDDASHDVLEETAQVAEVTDTAPCTEEDAAETVADGNAPAGVAQGDDEIEEDAHVDDTANLVSQADGDNEENIPASNDIGEIAQVDMDMSDEDAPDAADKPWTEHTDNQVHGESNDNELGGDAFDSLATADGDDREPDLPQGELPGIHLQDSPNLNAPESPPADVDDAPPRTDTSADGDNCGSDVGAGQLGKHHSTGEEDVPMDIDEDNGDSLPIQQHGFTSEENQEARIASDIAIPEYSAGISAAGANDYAEQSVHANDAESYLDAPIPSPFSDLGDMHHNMSTAESAIVSDIMLEDRHNVHQKDTTILAGTEEAEEEPHVAAQEASDQIEPQQEDGGIAAEDDDEDGQDVGGLIADIFGESDEEEEFEGFADEDLYPQREGAAGQSTDPHVERSDDSDQDIRVPAPQQEDSDDEDDDRQLRQGEKAVSDFELMMQRKKEMSAGRRRSKKDFDIISDNDDIIAAMINQMKEAAEEDRLLNQNGKAATKKLAMLRTVISHLRKVDLQHTFIDCGILPVLKEWLSPLPDNSLPHSTIREQLLRIISEFPAIDKGALKMSGIGRSIMLLYKHPKESRDNKKVASKIVAEWARPIFGVATKFTEMSREEREARDKMNVPANRKRRLSSDGGNSLDPDKRPRKPGDKGFVSRARVPMPSNKDYVIRPVSNFDGMADFKKSSKKSADRFEKQYRKFKDKKAVLSGGNRRAVKISLNGSKLAL